jgi:hypothetical protein
MPRLHMGGDESTRRKSKREVRSAPREHPTVITNVVGGAESCGELPTIACCNPWTFPQRGKRARNGAAEAQSGGVDRGGT